MPGLPDGYSVLFDVRLPAKRVKQLLTYLKDGAYLSPALTASLSLQLLTYSAASRTLGYWRANLTWDGAGAIHATSQAQVSRGGRRLIYNQCPRRDAATAAVVLH